MSTFEPEKCTPPSATERIGQQALSEIVARYGDGEHPGRGERNLPYHNLSHAIRVSETATDLARHLGLSLHDIELVRLLGWCHDVIHDSADGLSAEQRSADWLTERLVEAGYDAEELEIARLSILGTEPVISNTGQMVGQAYDFTTFPSVRAATIAACVASGDMEALLAPHGPEKAHDLFREWRGLQVNEFPETLDGLLDFQGLQMELVTTYYYPHPTAEELFGCLRQEVALYHQALQRDIAGGVVTSWQQVVEQDKAFRDKHAAKRL